MLPLTDAALILQGGSFRCMFSAGALDVLMEHGLWFSYVNGVSAGALAGCNYLSRQNGRTRRVNETFCTDPDFLSLRNRFRAGGVFNFPFLFRDVGERFPMDWEALMNSPQRFEAVATDCLTGQAAYFSKDEVPRKEFELACMASASMPGFSDMIRIRDVPYLDGGCACPVAYQRGFDLGYEKAVIIMTRPKGYRTPKPRKSEGKIWRRLYSRYPAFCRRLEDEERVYNRQYEELEQLEREGKVFLIRPTGRVKVGRLERDPQRLEALYLEGRRVMLKQLPALLAYLGREEAPTEGQD